MNSSTELIIQNNRKSLNQVLEAILLTFLNVSSTDIIEEANNLIKEDLKVKSYSFDLVEDEVNPPFYPYLQLVKDYIRKTLRRIR